MKRYDVLRTGVLNMWQGMVVNAIADAVKFERGVKEAKMAESRQRDWSTKMANTQAQRNVADLRAAGLNPILAAGGNTGSLPSSAQASIPSAPGGDYAGSASALETAKRIKNQRKREGIQLEIEKKAVDYVKKNPVINSALSQAKAAQLHGVDADIAFWIKRAEQEIFGPNTPKQKVTAPSRMHLMPKRKLENSFKSRLGD